MRDLSLPANRHRSPELLAPAGSPDALKAALEAGADAVYMGASAFNARANAENFDAAALRDGLAMCRAYGVKSYITLNTQLRQREIPDALRVAYECAEAGADAFITADLGLASHLRDSLPEVALHASTQASGHSVGAARFFHERGFTRMVCAREMSREEIFALAKISPIELEIFIHGAHCVSCSGQCMLSFVMGGRSGNRGACAQPCRMPWEVLRDPKKNVRAKDHYPLSLKDMCLAPHGETLADMPVSSLKIEGRMKSADYVYGVTRIYRRLLDEARNANPDEVRELAELFSRDGFTDGYFTGELFDRKRSMVGVRRDEDKRATREDGVKFLGLTRKVPLDLHLTAAIGEPMRLSAKAGERTVTVCGAEPLTAQNAPSDEESVRRSLLKLGNTCYTPGDVKIELDASRGAMMIPVSAINGIRREAIRALSDCSRLTAAEYEARAAEPKNTPANPENAVNGGFFAKKLTRTASFLSVDQIPNEAYGAFDILFVPVKSGAALADAARERGAECGAKCGVLFPATVIDSEMPAFRRQAEAARQAGAEFAIVTNPALFEIAREMGYTILGDTRLNAFNGDSAAVFAAAGAKAVLLSPELELSAIRGAAKALGDAAVPGAVVYGRIPVMVTERCFMRTNVPCPGADHCLGEKCRGWLADTRGTLFFAHGDAGAAENRRRCVLYNSAPIYMAEQNQQKELRSALGSGGNGAVWHFLFTDEDKDRVRTVIAAYQKMTPPPVFLSAFKRIK